MSNPGLSPEAFAARINDVESLSMEWPFNRMPGYETIHYADRDMLFGRVIAHQDNISLQVLGPYLAQAGLGECCLIPMESSEELRAWQRMAQVVVGFEYTVGADSDGRVRPRRIRTVEQPQYLPNAKGAYPTYHGGREQGYVQGRLTEPAKPGDPGFYLQAKYGNKPLYVHNGTKRLQLRACGSTARIFKAGTEVRLNVQRSRSTSPAFFSAFPAVMEAI